MIGAGWRPFWLEFSAALFLIFLLLAQQLPPLAQARIDLADVQDRICFEPDPYAAAQGAHALALVTEWSQYRTLDYRRIFAGMVQPAFLFDGRNLLDHRKLYEIGFNVFSIGKAALKHI